MPLSRRHLLALPLSAFAAAPSRRALLIDGQNNHDWRATTPLLQRYLEQSGLFSVTVLTTPPAGGGIEAFSPDFTPYDLVVLNYNGEEWSAATRERFEAFLSGGKGLAVVHAADNAFPAWPAYNRMIGVGGWGNRNEASGPYLRLRDGRWTTEAKPGPGGHHGRQHAFAVTVRNPSHPITQGLPPVWMHAKDELYDSLRGPAADVTVLASAFSDPATGGTGEDEPLLMTIPFGRGRVFHTALGHGVEAMQSVDFIVTLQRGAEWAATGRVTQPVPADFPTRDQIRSRS